jgi:hypothetical protein
MEVTDTYNTYYLNSHSNNYYDWHATRKFKNIGRSIFFYLWGSLLISEKHLKINVKHSEQ